MINPFNSIISNNIDELNEYLEDGNVNIVDERGASLLHYAIKLHNNEIVNLLIKSYINVFIADDYGNTAYHYSVINNRLGYLKTLIKMFGYKKIYNNFYQTPLYLACLYGRTSMVSLILEYEEIDLGEKDSNEESIFIAMVKSGNTELISKFNDFPKYIEIPNYYGDTPLAIAVLKNNYKMVKFLIDNNSFINSKNKYNCTPLHYAVINGDKEIIELLLTHGALMDIKNKDINNCWDLLNDEYLKEFIEDKINSSKIKKYKNNYPLHYAIYLDNEEKIDKELNAINISKVDCFGYLPIDIAKKYNKKTLIKKINQFNREIKILNYKFN